MESLPPFASVRREDRNRSRARCVYIFMVLLLAGCGGGENGPMDPGPHKPEPPPPGPHFSVMPIPVENIARITLLGFNNNVFPTSHTYWLTCDNFTILKSQRPCYTERLPIRAPAGGIIRDVASTNDGGLRVEGPPGLIWTFGHVTPTPGLMIGAQVSAGDTVATMFYNHGFDFGLTNYAVEHTYITPSRYPDQQRHGEHPIAQFPEPLYSELRERTMGIDAGLGQLSWDVPESASGNWFIRGAPRDNAPMAAWNNHMLLLLARYTERPETRILSVGQVWPGMQNRLLAVDPDAPAWESITTASGPLAIRLWNMGTDALPRYDWPGGTIRMHMTSPDTLRIEWFDTHEPVDNFTAAARVYER